MLHQTTATAALWESRNLQRWSARIPREQLRLFGFRFSVFTFRQSALKLATRYELSKAGSASFRDISMFITQILSYLRLGSALEPKGKIKFQFVVVRSQKLCN